MLIKKKNRDLFKIIRSFKTYPVHGGFEMCVNLIHSFNVRIVYVYPVDIEIEDRINIETFD